LPVAADRRAAVGGLQTKALSPQIAKVAVILSSDRVPLAQAQRFKRQAFWRGVFSCCPACGGQTLYSSFLKVVDRCAACGEELHHHRADDAPPYFTIFIVAHIVIPLVLIVEMLWRPSLAGHMAMWIPLTLALTFLLMPAVKGAVVALQWALKMHGFEYAASGRPVETGLDA
jgi:uncharacterized protein (DUF983 family)